MRCAGVVGTTQLWLEFLPDHVALDGLGVLAHPAHELVVGRHFDGFASASDDCERDEVKRRTVGEWAVGGALVRAFKAL